MQPAAAIDQIDQTVVVLKDIVGADPLVFRMRVGLEISHFLGRERIGDVEDAQPLGKPGKWNFAASDFLDRLIEIRRVTP